MGVRVKVTVRYFAVLRDRAGVSEEVLETPCGSVGELVRELISSRSLGLSATLIRPAVNGAFVLDSHQLSDGDEVVLIPPVAGG